MYLSGAAKRVNNFYPAYKAGGIGTHATPFWAHPPVQALHGAHAMGDSGLGAWYNPLSWFGDKPSNIEDVITAAPYRAPPKITLTPVQATRLVTPPVVPRVKPPVPVQMSTQPTPVPAATGPGPGTPPQAPPSSGGGGFWNGLSNVLTGALGVANTIFSTPGASPNVGLPYNAYDYGGTTPPGPSNIAVQSGQGYPQTMAMGFQMPPGMLPIALGVGSLLLVVSLFSGGSSGGSGNAGPKIVYRSARRGKRYK